MKKAPFRRGFLLASTLTRWCGTDFVQRNIRAFVFLLLVKAQADALFQRAVDHLPSGKGDDYSDECADKLAYKTYTTHAA